MTMKFLNVRAAFLATVFSLLSLNCFADKDTEGWELAKDKSGIKIYTRSVVGSKINEFKAITEMETSVDKLVELYLIVDKCTLWLPDCETSRVVNKVSDKEFTVYRRVANPWPIKDRDYVLWFNVGEKNEAGEVDIQFNDIKNILPEEKCCVRMDMVKGFWKFTPSTAGKVIVTYQYHCNPGGGLSPGLINAALPDLPVETLTNIKKMISGT